MYCNTTRHGKTLHASSSDADIGALPPAFAPRPRAYFVCARVALYLRVGISWCCQCLWKNNPPDKNTSWAISFENTKSVAGLQFLLLGRMAKAQVKGLCFSQTTVSAMLSFFDGRLYHDMLYLSMSSRFIYDVRIHATYPHRCVRDDISSTRTRARSLSRTSQCSSSSVARRSQAPVGPAEAFAFGGSD